MAVALFWDVCELKMNVFNRLREDKCDVDLARCARVHRSWTEFALDALWFGYPGTDCEENRTRTTAIVSLSPSRRQNYASRMGVLEFTGSDVVLRNLGVGLPRSGGYCRVLSYSQPTLQILRLIDNIRFRPKWFTASFLTEVAQRCRNLEEISIQARDVPIKPAQLAHFLRSIRPRAVTFGFGLHATCRDELTLEPLGNMSQLQYLEILGGGSKTENKLPARAFIGLGSITRLKSLKIGTSFFPCCTSQDDSVRAEYFNPRHNFTRADALDMFSKLAALDHLSIFGGAAETGHLYSSISKYCPYLDSIELVGELHIRIS